MRILVTEDEKGVAGFLKQGFHEAGYAVDIASDGDEALAFIHSVEYDMVILDIMMPKTDGIEVLRSIRAERLLIPVLLLTARGDLSDKVGGLDSGADDYLTKPFAFPELLARVRALLRRPPVMTGSLLECEDIRMNLALREVRCGDRLLDLSPREFSLLEFFLRNTGQVLSRTQISEHVWENSFSTGTNVIDVYIGYLRKKIGGDRATSLIQTVRSVGYRFGSSK